MADGLISSKEKGRKETLRDVAERYLNELASRCMVQVRKHEYYNQYKSCRLHDLMRDLCLSKGEEKGFLKLIVLYEQTKYGITSAGTASRLAIHRHGDANDYFNKEEEVTNLRSLLVLQKEWGRTLKISAKDTVKLKRLRTLALEKGEFVLANEVGKLIHLRYLSLFGSRVEQLPMSITNLSYLHTLDLRMMMDYIQVPNVIFKIKRLKHLFLNRIKVIGQCGEKLILDGLEELETLRDESYRSCVHFADIPKLKNLRNLETDVGGDDQLSIIVHHMSSETIQLREAHLEFFECDFSSVEGSNNLNKMLMSPSLTTFKLLNSSVSTGFTLPHYQQGMCVNLVDFTLRVGGRIEGGDFMEILGKFPMLKTLELGVTKFHNGEMRCLATSFPQLKFLTLYHLYNLERWVVDKGALPNLSSLRIQYCHKMEMIPDGLQFITTLQELTTQGMPKEFNDRLREVVNGQPGEDYHKVRHIPSISLMDLQW